MTTILTGNQIMFYFGDSWGWGTKYINNGSSDVFSGNAGFNEKSTYFTIARVAAARYYVSNETKTRWSGVQMASTASAGAFYKLNNDDGSNNIAVTAGVVPIFGTTSYSKAAGTVSSGIAVNTLGKSSTNRAQTVYYYYSTDEGTSWTGFDPSDISGLAVNTYKVRAIACDGLICVKSSNEASLTINEVSEPAITKLTVSDADVYSAEGSITLTATKNAAASSLDIQYQVKVPGGSWANIGSATSSTTQTYSPTSGDGTYEFRAYPSGYSSNSSTVSKRVYEHFTVHIKNTDSWSGMWVYMWNGSGNAGAWPGTQQSAWNSSNKWYNVTLDTKYETFIISQGDGDHQSGNISMIAASNAGNCYTTTSGTTLPSTTCPNVPSVTTTAASSILNTSATVGCNITNFNSDDAQEYGIYYSTNSALSTSNLSVGTKVKIGDTKSTTGNNAKSLTGLTVNTTYYVIAYAKNCAGIGYGSKISFTTLAQSTVTFDKQGGSGGSDGTTAINTKAMPSGLTAPTRTGYTFKGYYENTDGADKKYYNANMTSANAWDKTTASVTIYAYWTANTYTVSYDANGGTGTTANSSHTYDEAKALTANGYTKTGYSFGGWATSQANADAGTKAYDDGESVTNLSSDQGATVTLYAIWTPNTYSATFSQSGEGYSSGSVANQSPKYGQAMPSITPPTAANGYAFMGYFDAADGAGTQYYNADGTSAHVWDKTTDATLYAYFKKAEITKVTLNATTVAPGASVTATPTIDPTPAGQKVICWKILRSNGNLLEDLGSGDTKIFTAPSASGNYKVACILRTGNTCGAGTRLDSVVTDFVVAGAHTVTIRYQDGDGRTIAASASMEGRPLAWSDNVTAPAITGYTFTRWDAGEGILIKDGNTENTVSTSTANPIKIKANYDGTLTAVYSKKNILYFNNTLGWDSVFVYFYKDGNYWSNDKNSSGSSEENVYGSGANTSHHNGSYTGKYGEMTNIEGTNIWYFDYSAAGIAHSNYITFTKDKQHSFDYFYNTEVVRLADAAHYFDKPATMPMYVPLATKYELRNKTGEGVTTKYYTEGYWMNYPENTGYTLKIYDGTGNAANELHSIPFSFTSNKTMPMTITVELNANTTYGFKIYRNDGSWYGNNGTMKINASGDEGQAVWEFTTSGNNCGLKTSAAGDYSFTLTYGEKNAGNYYYLVGVHYPASVGSYRLVYEDLAKWSLGTTHTASWSHSSRVIYKNEGVADTVSFFVAKGSSPKIQIQKITAINSEGIITWANVGSAVSYDTVSAAGVYNFITSQTATALSIDKVEPYTGNYYIRTDAVDGKWDNYRTGSDHLMTYSAFSESRETNQFGELFSHYKAKWCPRETNVKFCIANDYSSCITDTLTQDVPNTHNNINEGGWLNSQKNEGKSELEDKYSANIRFMWNRTTNKISRAYISSSTNTDKKFLVLQSNATFWNSDGSNLSGSGESHANKEAIFKDNENWIYEREIKVTTGSRFKLYACYAQDAPSASNAQYFRGAYDSGKINSDDNSVILIGGNGTGTCNARLIYDFKTNRLIAAYLPDGSEISGKTEIDADLMIIREHQEAGQQITFENSSSELDKVKTVYGVMRFNRWILNNRANPTDMNKDNSKTNEAITQNHPLLDSGAQKSSSERGLYWISFPFNVNLSEVFGFGTYGTHWIIMRYNGEKRAKEGFWADSEGFWEYIWDRTDVTLKAGMGYVLALDLDLMQATDRTFWSSDIQQVELYFPSISPAGKIKQTTATVDVPEYKCTIDRTGNNGPDINKNRTKVDSDWNIIGVPSYANYGSALTDDNGTVTWNDNSSKNWTNDLPFLYEWNATDNTYTVQSGHSYAFKAMHAYYVQYHGRLTWTLASAATPSSIVARRAYAEAPQTEEFRLELQQNDKMIDQTFVRMSNDEEVSAAFQFGEDISKETNAGKANVYTLIDNYIPAAGNSLPMSEKTTVVPVGVKTTAAGEYTFAMPEGTNGTGVVLVDTENGMRTNLALGDYTVTLGAGTTDGRFVLEISPVANTPTGIGIVQSDDVQRTKARKVMVDGVLYIVKDGKIYDAQGTRVR